jgi:hypothetical protein
VAAFICRVSQLTGTTPKRERQNAVLDALQRTQRFLDENSALLTGIVDLAAGRQRLDEVIATFTGHAFDQDVGDRNARSIARSSGRRVAITSSVNSGHMGLITSCDAGKS